MLATFSVGVGGGFGPNMLASSKNKKTFMIEKNTMNYFQFNNCYRYY